MSDMLHTETFSTFDYTTKHSFIAGILSVIDGTKNKALLFCKKMFEIKEEPSETFLNYVFTTINNQLGNLKQLEKIKITEQFEKMNIIIEKNRTCEIDEKKNLDTLLDKM